MIIATFQTYNENEKQGKPFTRDFPDEQALYKWWNAQDGHPYLSYSLIGKEEIESKDLELAWDNWKPSE